jgi:Ion channel
MGVRWSIEVSRRVLRRLFLQRCCYLFMLLLALITISPFMEGARGGYLLAGFNAFIVLSAAATVGRTVLSFLVVFVLIGAAVSMRFASQEVGQDALFNYALLLHVLIYLTVIALLLRYVFGPETMDADRLWGAASVYLMIGILWCFIYAITAIPDAAAFLMRGEPVKLSLTGLLYFSFSTLTTIGFGDIVPVTRAGQVAAILEGIFGTLFLAILIAKLVGVYPPPGHEPSPRGTAPEGTAQEEP